ncbi:MAG: SRPBCC family protein [Acidobacteriota bacterium]|nr:SRPBCC family protein [Acidobacteriota bacterium]
MKWLKWLAVAVLALIALFLIVLGIGASVSERHVASTRVELDVPAMTVWNLLTDFEQHPMWRDVVHSMERLPDQDDKPVWRENNEFGPITYVVDEFSPPTRLVTRIADPELPFGGSWTYEIVPTGEGCTLQITEAGEIYNPFFRFMARFVFGYHATQEHFLESVADALDREVELERLR